MFHEVASTCLGYGAASITGSGIGAVLSERLLETAEDIVALGIDDPDLFLLLPLLESGVGPDLISDMTTNIILPDLADYSERVLNSLEADGERRDFSIRGRNYSLFPNVCAPDPIPVILVPTDVLRDLPIAADWDEVMDAAAANADLRRRVNAQVGRVWHASTKREKQQRRDAVLGAPEAMRAFLDAFHSIRAEAYDVGSDPEGYLRWRDQLNVIAWSFPRRILPPARLNLEGVRSVAEQILEQFRFLIEERRLSRILWDGDRPLKEFFSQRLFFAVAYSYCEANDLDITPEADTDSGAVDFKVSRGFRGRVLVEIKLSRNPHLVHGYETQLDVYREAEETAAAFYVIVNVGNLGEKYDRIMRIKAEREREGQATSEVWLIDGMPREAASRR